MTNIVDIRQNTVSIGCKLLWDISINCMFNRATNQWAIPEKIQTWKGHGNSRGIEETFQGSIKK